MKQENTQVNESSSQDGTPSWLKTVAIIALIWNILGLLAFAGQLLITPEVLAQLPEAEQALYKDIPAWATAAFGVAVIGGTLASVLLLMKNGLAAPIYLASLAGVIVQDIHAFLMTDVIAVKGATSVIMPAVVLIVSVMLFMLAKKGKDEEWLK